MTAEGLFDVAKNVAAICGAIVAVAAVWKIPAVSGSVRWVGRRLVSEPLSGWAQRQVGLVVDERMGDLKEQSTASTAWLAEGQARVGEQVLALRAEWTGHGERLDAIEARTRQLQPNGGKSIYDRIGQIEGHLGLPSGVLPALPPAPLATPGGPNVNDDDKGDSE